MDDNGGGDASGSNNGDVLLVIDLRRLNQEAHEFKASLEHSEF